jgi:cell division septum initiation protein DivIVA
VLNPSNRVQSPPTIRPTTVTEPTAGRTTVAAPTVRPGPTAAPQGQTAPQGQAAGAAAAAPRGKAGADAQTLLASLDSKKLPDADTRLEAARKTKGIKLDYSALKKRLQDIRKGLAEAQRNQKAGKSDLSLQQAMDIQKQIDDVEKIIADALKKAGAGGDAPKAPQPSAPGARPGGGKPASP